MSAADPQILRAKALALLQEAHTLDGRRPFIVTHSHRAGSTAYIGWFKGRPSEHEAAGLLEEEFEPEREEYLSIDDTVSLESMAGVNPGVVLAGG